MDTILASIPPLTPAQWCQAFFTLAAAGIVAVAVLPSRLGRPLLGYGPRSYDSAKSVAGPGSSWLEDLVSTVTALGQVPHSWFASFYVASVACSAFWAHQYIVGGSLMHLIASAQRAHEGPSSAGSRSSARAAQAVVAAWALMSIQGARRLYEQLFVAKKSSSTMWFVHWVLGFTFYVVMSLAVWVEGADLVLSPQPASTLVRLPSAQTALGTAIFVVGSVAQHRCHKHLASLKKYSLPTEGLFRYLVCPHYSCECLLYLALAVVAAPESRLVNPTIMSALLFVAVNLGATAYGTRKWYAGKFGASSVSARWIMIPLVY